MKIIKKELRMPQQKYLLFVYDDQRKKSKRVYTQSCDLDLDVKTMNNNSPETEISLHVSKLMGSGKLIKSRATSVQLHSVWPCLLM